MSSERVGVETAMGTEMGVVDVPCCGGDEGSYAQEDDGWGAHVERNVMEGGEGCLCEKSCAR